MSEEPLYYAISDAVTPGKVIHMAPTEWTHEAVIFNNPLEFAYFAVQVGRRMVPLKDAPPKWPPITGKVHLSDEDEHQLKVRWMYGYSVGRRHGP